MSATGSGRPRRGPGMTEVARAAGVSRKTVSRVVNGEPHVSPEVRDRVLRAVQELGYRPNNAARALLLGRYRRIGVVSLGSWADGLQPQGAEELATYDHPHFGRRPAATTHRHGAGRITYVGTVPGPAFARAVFEWAAPASWRPSHPSVTATSATARDGRRIRFLHNWSWETVSVAVPAPVRDVLTDAAYADEVPLGPWDVKVLTEDSRKLR